MSGETCFTVAVFYHSLIFCVAPADTEMIICVLCSSFQQLCVETPGSSVQDSTFLLELREEGGQFHATCVILITQSSSVKKNVKEKVFSLKQKMSELRMADSALNIEENLLG